MHKESYLIQKIKLGDKRAFKELYDKNVGPLYRFMMQFSPNKDVVEDWVQRAFIKSYENIQKFEGLSLYSTWLFKIALNEMRNDYRTAGTKAHFVDDEDEYPSSVIQDADFEWNYLMKELLGELDEVKKAVFVLYEVEGYSHSEIAEILNIKEATSRTILTRTKKWLQNKWIELEEVK